MTPMIREVQEKSKRYDFYRGMTRRITVAHRSERNAVVFSQPEPRDALAAATPPGTLR
jgi:hypothetical protein